MCIVDTGKMSEFETRQMSAVERGLTSALLQQKTSPLSQEQTSGLPQLVRGLNCPDITWLKSQMRGLTRIQEMFGNGSRMVAMPEESAQVDHMAIFEPLEHVLKPKI